MFDQNDDAYVLTRYMTSFFMSGLPITEDDDASTGHERPALMVDQLLGKSGSKLPEEESKIMPDEESIPVDLPDCIVKCKSAFKCRLCPRIVCLNEESLRAHLNSKVRCVAYVSFYRVKS